MRDFLGFIAFLIVLLAMTVVVAYTGTYTASTIWHLTGWGAGTIRWAAIGGIFGSAVVGLRFMKLEEHQLNTSAMCAFLAMAVFAATWMGAVGTVDVIRDLINNHQITNSVIEVLFGFVLIMGGLVGGLVNSGFSLGPKS